MGRIHLVTGGCRSGKSAYALKVAESSTGAKLYIATCPVMDGDSEMTSRVKKHKRERESRDWQTFEETVSLPEAVSGSGGYEAVLIDCLALWVNNLIFACGDNWPSFTEDSVSAHARKLLAAAARHPGTVLIVTNEVGMGIVPANDMARHYRDLLGRCNQIIATGADSVTMMVSGIPLSLKG